MYLLPWMITSLLNGQYIWALTTAVMATCQSWHLKFHCRTVGACIQHNNAIKRLWLHGVPPPLLLYAKRESDGHRLTW